LDLFNRQDTASLDIGKTLLNERVGDEKGRWHGWPLFWLGWPSVGRIYPFFDTGVHKRNSKRELL